MCVRACVRVCVHVCAAHVAHVCLLENIVTTVCNFINLAHGYLRFIFEYPSIVIPEAVLEKQRLVEPTLCLPQHTKWAIGVIADGGLCPPKLQCSMGVSNILEYLVWGYQIS